MTILHVTDFHFNQRWFDWLRERAPEHDLLVMSGDLLDLAAPTPTGKQIDWVSAWLADYPTPISVCSGNHDLMWDSEAERWRPAYWLREISNPNLSVDGQQNTLDGFTTLNIGCATRPKGRDADAWVVHGPPAMTGVARRANGRDGGDIDLVAPLKRHAPAFVFCGHVHDPSCWFEHHGPSLLLNPGRLHGAPFPNHLIVQTDSRACAHVSAATSARPEIRLTPDVPATILAAACAS